jgi:tRNA threonylcarbamoyl adenosine modification protein (Sua5/YciO/YrdC/YwlC family)
LKRAAEILAKGGLLCYPTETGYGIGCDMYQRKTVERLFRLTNRPKNKPASLLCKDFKQVSQFGYINNVYFRIARRIFPGPYTLVLEATKEVPRHLHGKRREVGIRVPSNPVIMGILEEMENPIMNVAARTFEGEYIDDPHVIEHVWRNELGAVIDCDLLQEDPSTVVDLTGDVAEILREGQGDPNVFL